MERIFCHGNTTSDVADETCRLLRVQVANAESVTLQCLQKTCRFTDWILTNVTHFDHQCSRFQSCHYTLWDIEDTNYVDLECGKSAYYASTLNVSDALVVDVGCQSSLYACHYQCALYFENAGNVTVRATGERESIDSSFPPNFSSTTNSSSFRNSTETAEITKTFRTEMLEK